MSGDLRDSGPGRVPGARTARESGGTLQDCTRFAPAAAVALLVGAAQPALAASGFHPFVLVGYEHNSNVFMRPDSAPPFAAEGISALGDSIFDYEAGLGSELDWGPDRLTLDASATRDRYDRFSFLNHYEYVLDANLHWESAGVLDGTLTYDQTRYMAPFTDTFTTALLLDTDRTAKVAVRLLVTPQWRLDLTPELHQTDTPLPGFAGFKVHDTTGIAGLDYLGFGKLTAGLQFTYDKGRYEDIAAATRYQQREFDLTAHYKVGGFSTFSASAGYTSRNSEANPADSVPAPAGGGIFAGYVGAVGRTSSSTGSLSYERQLTGKTSGTLSLFRRVDSYAAGANPEIATGGAVSVTWHADPKIRVNLDYGYTRDQIKGGLVVLAVGNRTDRTQTAKLEVHYEALFWLTVRPYVTWSKATSTLMLGNYSETILGVDATAHFF